MAITKTLNILHKSNNAFQTIPNKVSIYPEHQPCNITAVDHRTKAGSSSQWIVSGSPYNYPEVLYIEIKPIPNPNL